MNLQTVAVVKTTVQQERGRGRGRNRSDHKVVTEKGGGGKEEGVVEIGGRYSISTG